MRAAGLRTAIADLIERVAELCAIAIRARRGVLTGEHAGEDARSQHRRRKARAFLVRPVHHLDRREGFIAGAHQGAHRFECRQYAQRAIELAAGRLRVEMTAERDRRNVRPRTLAPREHVAHVVDRDGAAERFRLRAKPVAHLPVEIGQRQPADAAFGCRADPRRLHQVAPEAFGIDGEVFHGGAIIAGSRPCGKSAIADPKPGAADRRAANGHAMPRMLQE